VWLGGPAHYVQTNLSFTLVLLNKTKYEGLARPPPKSPSPRPNLPLSLLHFFPGKEEPQVSGALNLCFHPLLLPYPLSPPPLSPLLILNPILHAPTLESPHPCQCLACTFCCRLRRWAPLGRIREAPRLTRFLLFPSLPSPSSCSISLQTSLQFTLSSLFYHFPSLSTHRILPRPRTARHECLVPAISRFTILGLPHFCSLHVTSTA
jgi:hypothetical protein